MDLKHSKWIVWAVSLVLLLVGSSAITQPRVLANTNAASNASAATSASSSAQDEAAAQNDLQPFTIVVLPDTQEYCDICVAHARRSWGKDCSEYFPVQTRWIVNQRKALNIVFAIHLGDITQLDYDPEWELAVKAMSQLDGVVPYALCQGNHDVGCVPRSYNPPGRWQTATNRLSHFDRYFPKGKYDKQPWFGGSMDNTLINAYYTFQSAGMKFMIMTLEFKPRDEVLTWANKIVAEHPDYRVVVATHAYRSSKKNGQRRLTHAIDRYEVPGNNAEQMWQKFLSQHANIFMVLCGHIGGTGRDASEGQLASKGKHGNTVYQILADYQFWKNGGESWLRYMTFRPANNCIDVYTYNPVTGKYLDEDISRFTLKYEMTGGDKNP